MGTQGHEFEVWDEILTRGEDIGYNVVIRFFSTKDHPKAGLLLYHLHSDGSICGGGLSFKLPGQETGGPRWTVENWDPLTLNPSIRDPTCSENLHGHIVNGRWRPC